MTRGGKLTILNGFLWVIMVLGLVADYPPLVMLPALLVCWPLAWLSLILMFGGATPQGLVTASVIVGVNSILWGYGVSWLLSRVSSMGATSRGLEVPALNGPDPPRAASNQRG